MKRLSLSDDGFTLVEALISALVLAMIALAFMGLLTFFVNTSTLTKEKDQALVLASNQMEALRAKPYENLAVYSPTNQTTVVNGISYVINTSIIYVDDAYDGCGGVPSAYPTVAIQKLKCRDYPPPAGAPVVDTNPADFKQATVTVSVNSKLLASLDSYFAPRVAETASSTGALLVTVVNPSGSPLSGATVSVSNTVLSPNINLSQTTDSNGMAIFYGMPPDSNNDYVVSASDSGYSSVQTISANGSLTPTYPNQKILTQSASSITLTLGQMAQYGMLVQTTDTSGNPLSNVRVYLKGGYKKYIKSTDTTYYYDNMTPTDTRPTTDSNGLVGFQNLPPINSYFFFGDDGSIGCMVGNTKCYLATAIPYAGSNSLAPITELPYDPSNPPTITYAYNGNNYIQKVQLMITTNANFPRVFSINPQLVSASAPNLSTFSFTVNGANLGASSMTLTQGSTVYNGSACNGSSTAWTCQFNLTGVSTGPGLQITVKNSAGTLTIPILSANGGLTVGP